MAQPLTTGIAPDIELSGGYILRLTALDPTTGAVVSGVIVSGVAIQVETEEEPEAPPKLPPLTPLFIYERG